MKKSKSLFTRICQSFLKKFFPKTLFPYFLLLRTSKNFKKKINSEKQLKKFSSILDKINEYEYKITSQNNEDGIIEFIFSKIPNNKYFVEIGFEYYEFNSLNLIKKGWEGKLIDTSLEDSLALEKNLNRNFPNSKVRIFTTKVDKKNINDLVIEENSNKKIDFFSLDIDSYDYWILETVDLSRVSVLCCEYNHWLGGEKKLTIPYDENFKFLDDGIWGASITALVDLLKKKGFSLIAVESSGTNIFFVKNELAKNFEVLTPEKSFKSVGRFYDQNKKKEIFHNIKKNYHKLIEL
tara:strand:+ start:578 stop:1459 length:882 start_codon:yes stop_codon:yes gene_type:complete